MNKLNICVLNMKKLNELKVKVIKGEITETSDSDSESEENNPTDDDYYYSDVETRINIIKMNNDTNPKSKYYCVSKYEAQYEDFFDNYDHKRDEKKVESINEKKHEVLFLLQKIIRERDCPKWFDAIGIDLETGKLVSFPIRNDVITTYVNTEWGENDDDLSQWDFYKIIIKLSIPIFWTDDTEEGYWLPTTKEYTGNYLELLNERMVNEIDERSSPIEYVIWI